MSKCKAVLDSNKIIEIRVKIKAQKQQDKSEQKSSDKIDRTFKQTQQSE